MRTFTVVLEKDPDTGLFVAQCVEIPQAISQGKTEDEALQNVKEAIELALEHLQEKIGASGKRLEKVAIE